MEDTIMDTINLITFDLGTLDEIFGDMSEDEVEIPEPLSDTEMPGKLSRGKMPAAQHSVIQGKHEYLMAQLVLTPLIGHLYAEHVLDDDDIDKIKTAKRNGGNREGVELFLEILRHSGDQAYPKFLEALEKEDVAMAHVARELRRNEEELYNKGLDQMF